VTSPDLLAEAEEASLAFQAACKVDGCDRRVKARGLCDMHYIRLRRDGHPGEAAPRRVRHDSGALCAADGCEKVADSVTWCRAHYLRQYRHGDANVTLKHLPRSGQCKDCSSPVHQAGLCRKHYRLSFFYGVTAERYSEALSHGCEICGGIFDELVVDHDHGCCPTSRNKTCGKCVRGFLCSVCNSGIGKLKDDVKILQAAIRYLEGSSQAGRVVEVGDTRSS
jgi:hypothetical protein